MDSILIFKSFGNSGIAGEGDAVGSSGSTGVVTADGASAITGWEVTGGGTSTSSSIGSTRSVCPTVTIRAESVSDMTERISGPILREILS